MEASVLNYLKFEMTAATPKCFLRCFSVLFHLLSKVYDYHTNLTSLTLFLAYNRRFARAAQACDEVLYSQLLFTGRRNSLSDIYDI